MIFILNRIFILPILIGTGVFVEPGINTISRLYVVV